MKLTRRVTFSSGHRYWFDDLSVSENTDLFGPWASRFNHGHNYILEASIRGVVNDADGMVINIKILDSILRERIVSRFDQKSINDEVPEFRDVSPSLENLGLFIFGALEPLPEGVGLEHVRLFETQLLFCDVYEQSGDKKLTITRGYEFCASHRLHCEQMTHEENVALFGKCNNPNGHGHNYQLEVTVGGSLDARTGMITDIVALDEVVNELIVDRYDHKHLNMDIPEFENTNPTTEILTREIYRRLKSKLGGALKRVLVRETARNIFEYAGEDE